MSADLITSPANPRYRHARSLLHRKGRTQHAQLLLEGVRLIQDSMSAGFAPALFFYTESASAHAAALRAQIREQGGQALCLAPELMATLTDTVSSQQVVAVVSRPQLSPGHSGLHCLVDGLRDPGNLGTLLRSAAAAGVDQVHLLPGVVDGWSPKVLRAGMGAHFRIAIQQVHHLADVESSLAGLNWYRAEAEAALDYSAVDWLQPSVLIIGGEASGPLTTARLPLAQPISIPMARQVESLNAAVAASVILFEAVRQRRNSAAQG